MTPSDMMERVYPGWQGRSYGDLLRTTPSEWLSIMYAPFATQTPGPMTQPSRRQRHHDCGCGDHDDHERPGHHHHHHHHRHRCGDCGSDPCECFCCLGDVDLAVYTRVGEQRVVPIVVENERRREKNVTLELSDWRTRGGKDAPVDTVLFEPKAFTLAPCSEQGVTLVVKVRGDRDDDTDDNENVRATDAVSRQRLPDVDGCEVVTADLRLLGCDRRPVRIAVAILPRDCDPYGVGCGCTCC